MRKSFDGLAAAARNTIQVEPSSGAAFLFTKCTAWHILESVNRLFIWVSSVNLTKICPNLGGQPAFTQASPFHLLWGFSSVFFAQVKKQIRSIHGNPYGNVMLDNLPRADLAYPPKPEGAQRLEAEVGTP
jgi:hypothetical protein